MLSNRTMARIITILTVLFTLLIAPLIIKGAAFAIGAAVIILCPGVRTGVGGDCQSCSSEFCPITVMVTTTVLLLFPPLAMLVSYVGRRRKSLSP
jgi:hypothetical protein